MNLFFNGVSSHWYLALFSDSREILYDMNFQILWNESSKATDLIDVFLKESKVVYDDIKNICVVIGPWSFTGIRTISLIVNTLAYIYPKITLTWINFFELYDQYPVVKMSSKRDLFVKYKKNAKITIEQNSVFVENLETKSVYWDAPVGILPREVICYSEIDYASFLRSLELGTLKQVAPLYIKKPNIS